MKYRKQSHLAILLIVASMLFVFFAPPAQANTASLSGIAFADSNANGYLDGSEKGLAGVTLSLVRVSGQSESLIASQTSDKEGNWRFDGLAAGEYYLQVQLPSGYVASLPAEPPLHLLPSQGGKGRSPLFELADGEQKEMPLGGTKRSAYINIIAFGDLNMNGGRMSNEPLLRDVEVELLYEHNGEQFVIAHGLTNRDGELQLRDLSPATYRLGVTMPEPYIIGPLGSKINAFYNVIPPTENNMGQSEPFDLERSLGVGIGGVKAGTLTGRIWSDSNMDGQIDANEGGQAGIELTLTHLGLGISRTLVSTQEAGFVFEHLQAGEYQITANLPDGLMFALPGSPSLMKDGYARSLSHKLMVGEDGQTKLEPIGVMPASSVVLHAFHDSNLNGQPDADEPAFSGAVIESIENDKVLASAVTDAQGRAVLPRVAPGELTLRVSLPDGQVFTLPGGEGGNDFSDVSASSSLSISRTLDRGGQLAVFAGTTLPAAISGTLFEDSNLSGILDGSEGKLAGFTVQAIDEQGRIAAQAQTAQDGSYLLDQLVPGTYQVRFSLVSPYVFSQPSQTGQGTENQVIEQTVDHGQTAQIVLGSGSLVEQVDAGAFRSAVIQGAVLLGDEELGFAGNLGGLAGVLVELLDEEGQPVSEHTQAHTTADGAFSLKGALPGTYSLAFTLPADAKYSQPLTDEPAIKSDLMQVKAADVLSMQPIFAVHTGTVEGTAFHDVNNNATMDSTDPALAGVTLLLVNTRTAEEYTTQSDAQGGYRIAGIRPGKYEVAVSLPAGYALDSNAKSLTGPAINGQSQGSLEIGMGARVTGGLLSAVQPVTISGTAFYDNDLNLAFSALLDKPTELQFNLSHLRTNSVVSLSTDANGRFTTGPMFPGSYQLTVSLPTDHLLSLPQDAANAQGAWSANIDLSQPQSTLDIALIQLGSLAGSLWNMDGSSRDLAGIQIDLLDAQGKLLIEGISDNAGKFHFKDLLPVEYLLSARLPDSYRFARQVDTHSRPSVILSDLVGMDSASGRSLAIKLNMGEHKTAQDIGMGAMGKLGDFAWLDLDGDGMQDAGEPGLPGLVIKLYQYGQLSGQTTTDNYGHYLFERLFPGEYTMEVEMPAEVKPTKRQTEFRLVASILEPTEGQTARAEGVIVPSGGRNLNADLGFVLRQEGKLPLSLQNLPQKDWTRINEQRPTR